jgi:hypothetical protein
VTAVAVWERVPSADELLDRRLAEGWTPTPTRLQTGPAVLGHAACRVPG